MPPFSSPLRSIFAFIYVVSYLHFLGNININIKLELMPQTRLSSLAASNPSVFQAPPETHSKLTGKDNKDQTQKLVTSPIFP